MKNKKTISSLFKRGILNQVQDDVLLPKAVKNLASYRPNVLTSSKKAAFTLAEVLITLAIIGVVAALTIPNIVTKYQKRVTAIRLKKVYAEIVQAVKLSEIDNGELMSWDFPQKGYSLDASIPFIEKYYQPYFKGSKIHRYTSLQNYAGIRTDGGLILTNGTTLSFFFTGGSYIWLFVDINGDKNKPNIIGRDIFVFDVSNSHLSGGCGEIIFCGEKTRCARNSESFLRNSKYGYACNKDNSAGYKNFYCGALIKLNNWEIPEDYPW